MIFKIKGFQKLLDSQAVKIVISHNRKKKKKSAPRGDRSTSDQKATIWIQGMVGKGNYSDTNFVWPQIYILQRGYARWPLQRDTGPTKKVPGFNIVTLASVV